MIFFLFFCHNHVAPINKNLDLSKWRERFDAQPLKQQALAEVAEPCMGLVFIISIMAAVFNMFVCVLDHFLFHFL